MKRVVYTHPDSVSNLQKHYETLYQRDPRSRIFAPLADTYRKQGRVDDAIKLCLTGLKVHSNYSSGRLVLGKSLFDKKMYDRAIQELDQVIRVNPTNMMAHIYLGKSYLAIQDYERALSVLVKARELAPHYPKLDKIIERLESKTRLVYRDTHAFAQATLKDLTKRSLFSEESDHFVLRPVKQIFMPTRPRTSSMNVTPDTQTAAFSSALKNLFISQGLEEKAGRLSKEREKEMTVTVKEPVRDQDFVINNVNVIPGPVITRKYDIKPLLEEASIELPRMIKLKHDILFDSEDTLITQAAYPNMPPVALDLKQYDGLASDKMESLVVESVKTPVKKEKKKGSPISVHKLTHVLNRIQERAY